MKIIPKTPLYSTYRIPVYKWVNVLDKPGEWVKKVRVG